MKSLHHLSTWAWKYTRPIELFSRCNNQTSGRWAHACRSFATSSSISYPNDSAAPDSDLVHRPAAPLLRYPPSPTNLHHDLASYASYAVRTGLDPLSNTYVGTHFEYVVAASLSRFGFSLRRIGGRSDAGIDLLGVWAVPNKSRPSESASADSSDVGGRTNINDLRVILQCKASAGQTRIGPQMVRELEGAFSGAPPGWRRRSLDDDSQQAPPVLAILATEKPATKGMREALGRSRWPLGLVSCSRDGIIEQLLWNRPAEDIGLGGLGVTVQHFSPDALERSEGDRKVGRGRKKKSQAMGQRLVLTWDGKTYNAQALAAGIPFEQEEALPIEEAESTKA